MNYKHRHIRDIALIKIQEEIGSRTGWIGIAFTDRDSDLENTVMHKFSYPGSYDITDSSRVFTGDTLRYNYGTLDHVNRGWFGYDIPGVPGQSGSSLMYTDNRRYYTYGTSVYVGNSRHLRITREIFYGLKSILDPGPASHLAEQMPIEEYQLSEAYPNPFNVSTNIEYTLPSDGRVRLTVYNLRGRVVRVLVDEFQSRGTHLVRFRGDNLASGVFLIRFTAENYSEVKKVILVR